MLSAIDRLRLRRQAAELVARAMEATDQTMRKRLLAEARSINDKIEREGSSQP
jgi:hypothetical protein